MLITAHTKAITSTANMTEIDGFSIATETPVAFGGTGEFPPATRMVIAALLNCSFSSLRAFCEKRGISTDELGMDFSGNYENGVYTDMTLALNLPEEFEDKYRDSIDKIFASCAVKKIVKNLPEINICVK